jgi:ATP-dependent DNA ligase
MKQELIICGYTAPQGSRSYFGALLVGYYDNNKLIYAGKVGTGYSEDILETLGKKLQKLAIKKCPFADYTGPTKDITWVKPELVAEFQFAQWTNAGKLRVGRYKGLRDDKAAKDVVQETIKPIGPSLRQGFGGAGRGKIKT